MRSLWISKTYIEILLVLWNEIYQGGWDLSKEVLWISVCQWAPKLQAVKVGGLKKILPPGPPRTTGVRPGFDSRMKGSSSNFDSLQLCSQLTYRDPQYLFGKILTPLTNSSSIERIKGIFNASYALSKWPHLYRAYVVNVPFILILSVYFFPQSSNK